MSDDSFIPSSSPPRLPPPSSRKRQRSDNALNPRSTRFNNRRGSSGPQLKKTRVKLETPSGSPVKLETLSSSSPHTPRASALHARAENGQVNLCAAFAWAHTLVRLFYLPGGSLDSQTDSQTFVDNFYRKLDDLAETKDAHKPETRKDDVFSHTRADELSGCSQPVDMERSDGSQPAELSNEWWAEPITREQAFRIMAQNEKLKETCARLEERIEDIERFLRLTEEDLA
ncbi:hypothetical protein GGX14DRAFT_469276, partial [Mycena pura]